MLCRAIRCVPIESRLTLSHKFLSCATLTISSRMSMRGVTKVSETGGESSAGRSAKNYGGPAYRPPPYGEEIGCIVRRLSCSEAHLCEVTGEASREAYVIQIRPARRIVRNGGHMRRVRGITCLVFVQSRQLPHPQLLTAPLHRLFPGNCEQIPNAPKRHVDDSGESRCKTERAPSSCRMIHRLPVGTAL